MTGPSPRGRGAVRSAVLRPAAHGAVPAQAGNRASTLPLTEASGRLSRTPIHRPDRDGELPEAEGALLGPAGRWYWSAPVALDDASTTAEDDHAWAQLEGPGTRAHTGSATGGRQARPLNERGDPFDAKINCFGAALVGASPHEGAISCAVHHGGKYQWCRPDKGVTTQWLLPKVSTRHAETMPLPPPEEGIGDTPLTAPTPLAFWGRSLGGAGKAGR